jgi:hemoglobin
VDEAELPEPLENELWGYLEMAAQSLMNTWA